MSVKDKEDKLVFNRGHHGKLTEEHYSPGKAVAYFSGKEMTDGVCEAKQWLEAILNAQPYPKKHLSMFMFKDFPNLLGRVNRFTSPQL